MQLKSGDSYLSKRQRDGAEVFQIKNARWATYWQQQAYPVMLVIRNSAGDIRWMDVSAYLKRESDNGKKPVKLIVFKGEQLDVRACAAGETRCCGLEFSHTNRFGQTEADLTWRRGHGRANSHDVFCGLMVKSDAIRARE